MIYSHGVRLPRLKKPATEREIATLTDVGRLYVPLRYDHTGERQTAWRPVVKPYETVVAGEPFVQPEQDGLLRPTPQAAPVTGVFLGLRRMNHPLLGEVDCAELDCVVGAGGPDQKTRLIDELMAEEVLEIARLAGVVDETDGRYLCDKLREARGAGDFDLLLADGIENQPYASSAAAVLEESARKVETGLRLAAYAAGILQVKIGVSDMLPPAQRRSLQEKLVTAGVVEARGKYPHVWLGRRLEGVRVLTVGVQALLALYRAALYEEPHITAVVTVAGSAVKEPQNLRVPFGTPVSALLRYCGLRVPPDRVRHVVLGDAMTGVGATSEQTPVVPGVTCVLAIAEDVRLAHGVTDEAESEVEQEASTQDSTQGVAGAVCCGCGRCLRACPVGLMPFKILRKLSSLQYERLPALHPERCVGCGACSYVCPVGLELAVGVAQAREAMMNERQMQNI